MNQIQQIKKYRGCPLKKTKMFKYFVGIDPSLTATGVIVLDKKGDIVERGLISTKNNKTTEERIIDISKAIMMILVKYEDIIVYIEGLSNNSFGKTSSILELSALNFFLRIFFLQNAIKYKVIEPTKLKKFVTDKGNAKKELMLLKVYKRWNVEFEDNNLCDAYALSRYSIQDSKNIKDIK
jgi:crossover junction endodeoxyribonuclease RuvC